MLCFNPGLHHPDIHLDPSVFQVRVEGRFLTREFFALETEIQDSLIWLFALY